MTMKVRARRTLQGLGRPASLLSEEQGM